MKKSEKYGIIYIDTQIKARCGEKMIYVSSDWHGYPLEGIKELLGKADFSQKDYLFVLGDVIDRGENSAELLKFLMYSDNIELIRGNHEAMMLNNLWLFDEVTSKSIDDLSADKLRAYYHWQRNGADATIESLAKEHSSVREHLVEFISEAPLYDSVSVGSKDFLLVHGGLGNFRDDKKISEYEPRDLYWERPSLNTVYSHSFTTIFGHTPTMYYGEEYKGRIIKQETWINIDTGAASGLSPCLLRLDDMKEFYLDR